MNIPVFLDRASAAAAILLRLAAALYGCSQIALGLWLAVAWPLRLVHVVAVLAAAFALCACVSPDAREDASGCSVPRGYRAATSQAELPPALKRKFQGFVMPGEDWNTGDIGVAGQGVFFIWHRGAVWIAELGYGGIGTIYKIVVYRVDAGGQAATEVTPAATELLAPCDAAHGWAHDFMRR